MKWEGSMKEKSSNAKITFSYKSTVSCYSCLWIQHQQSYCDRLVNMTFYNISIYTSYAKKTNYRPWCRGKHEDFKEHCHDFIVYLTDSTVSRRSSIWVNKESVSQLNRWCRLLRIISSLVKSLPEVHCYKSLNQYQSGSSWLLGIQALQVLEPAWNNLYYYYYYYYYYQYHYYNKYYFYPLKVSQQQTDLMDFKNSQRAHGGLLRSVQSSTQCSASVIASFSLIQLSFSRPAPTLWK